jgi:hypothetical protein
MPRRPGHGRTGSRAIPRAAARLSAERRLHRAGVGAVGNGLGWWTVPARRLGRGVQRWKRSPDPLAPPDRVGVDPRREGKDEFTAAPAWGPTAGALLRLYADAQLDGIAMVERSARSACASGRSSCCPAAMASTPRSRSTSCSRARRSSWTRRASARRPTIISAAYSTATSRASRSRNSPLEPLPG